jgi:3',5'-cyclic AMP phosphodiesterase CpdA
MVKHPRPWAFCFLLVLPILLSGCNVDVLGFFGSTDFNERFRDRDTFNFLTAAELRPAFAAPYAFIVISDTHIENGDAHGLEGLAAVIRGANAGGANIRFAVVTGDITQNGGRRDLEKFLEIAESLRSLSPPAALYPVIGNHDIYSGNWSLWRELIGSSSYLVESPDTALIMMDSANANFGRDQLEWLEDRLGGAKKHTFIFSHANLFTESIKDIEMFTDTRERAKALSMLKGRCDAVFSGHVHRRIIREAGGVRYITLEDFKGHSNYCLVRVDTAGGVSWEFKKL